MNSLKAAILTVDAHCGTAAPLPLSARFSLERGYETGRYFRKFAGDSNSIDDDDSQRVCIISWGQRVAQATADSDYNPFQALARHGNG